MKNLLSLFQNISEQYVFQNISKHIDVLDFALIYFPFDFSSPKQVEDHPKPLGA